MNDSYEMPVIGEVLAPCPACGCHGLSDVVRAPASWLSMWCEHCDALSPVTELQIEATASVYAAWHEGQRANREAGGKREDGVWVPPSRRP